MCQKVRNGLRCLPHDIGCGVGAFSSVIRAALGALRLLASSAARFGASLFLFAFVPFASAEQVTKYDNTAQVAYGPVGGGVAYVSVSPGRWPTAGAACAAAATFLPSPPSPYGAWQLRAVQTTASGALCIWRAYAPTDQACDSSCFGATHSVTAVVVEETVTCGPGEFWRQYPEPGRCVPHTCTSGERSPFGGGGLLSACIKTPHGECQFAAVTVATPKGSKLVYEATGQKCDSSSEPQDAPSEASDDAAEACGQLVCPPKTDGSCKSGYTKGTIAGVSSCVRNVSDTTTETKTDKNADGSDSKTTTQTETRCEGDKCTTITTVAEGNADGTTTTVSTSTKEQSRDSYCAQNPRSTQCGDAESSWGGSCSAGFTCSGDPVQCAQARAAWAQKCAFDVDPQHSVVSEGRSAVAGIGSPVGDRQTFSVAAAIQGRAYGPTSGCLSDESIYLLGREVVIPWSKLCPYLNMLGWGGNAVTFVYAMLLVFGRRS